MSIFSKFSGGYEELWKAIIRPPKDQYDIKELGKLFNNFTKNIQGPKTFRLQGKKYQRSDFEIINSKGFKIQCSHFEPIKRVAEELPCVIYLHGNCSSRVESLPSATVLLPLNITLCAIDFAGCGHSEGEYISLGWYERDDVQILVDNLRSKRKVSAIGIWGRSMGAVTALMHADRDPSIAGIVLDSPFSNLRVLAEELAKQYGKLPGFITSTALSFIKKTVKAKADFDIDQLSPIDHVKEAFIPAFFIAGKDDNFILPEHTKILHQAYSGDKNLVIVDGDHNTLRPEFLMDSISIFFYNTLQCHLLPTEVQSGPQQNSQPVGEIEVTDLFKSVAPRKIGNEELVSKALNENFDVDELQFAIEESLKLQSEDKNKNLVEEKKE